MRLLVVVLAVGLLAVAAAGSVGADAGGPSLVGGDYYATGCSGGGGPTLQREQMFAMHASGLNSLGLVINYSTDPNHTTDDHGGAWTIQSDGTLNEPYRSWLIEYLKDAREAGFTDVTIRFQAHGPNSPEPWTSGGYLDQWDPSTYEADWHFIAYVRGLTKQYGPPESHFDLMAEGPPSDWVRNQLGGRIDQFISSLYTNYVNAFGSSDVFFSAIDKDPAGDDVRLVNLIEDLRSTGEPLPPWWGLDIEYTGPAAAKNLADAEATLNAFGLSGSLALEETAYESPDVSAAVQSFDATAAHPIVQVEEYPNWGTPDCVPAPYTGNAYLTALGIKTNPLLARIDAQGRPTLTTSDGIPVVALKAGRYTITVTDASRKAGFKLTGFRVSRHTAAAFRGTVTWTVNVDAANPTYRAVGAPGTRSVSFTVLP
jgi:hypothetical protein